MTKMEAEGGLGVAIGFRQWTQASFTSEEFLRQYVAETDKLVYTVDGEVFVSNDSDGNPCIFVKDKEDA